MADYIKMTRGLILNPVGSRSVSRAMGFASPYDVDAAGRRGEFQRRLTEEKVAWEATHENFVTDRTTLDNIAYTTMHDARHVDRALFGTALVGLARYTHVVYCPVSVFCDIANDPARINDFTYHVLYNVLVDALIAKYLPQMNPGVRRLTLDEPSLKRRQQMVDEWLVGTS
jgi:hypothetical protein